MGSNGFMIGPGIKEIWAIKVGTPTVGHPVDSIHRKSTVCQLAQENIQVLPLVQREIRDPSWVAASPRLGIHPTSGRSRSQALLLNIINIWQNLRGYFMSYHGSFYAWNRPNVNGRNLICTYDTAPPHLVCSWNCPRRRLSWRLWFRRRAARRAWIPRSLCEDPESLQRSVEHG